MWKFGNAVLVMNDDKFGDHHVVDQVICTDRLTGYYIIDNPRGGPRRDGTEPGLLYVEKRSDGRWYDSELDCRITADGGRSQAGAAAGGRGTCGA